VLLPRSFTLKMGAAKDLNWCNGQSAEATPWSLLQWCDYWLWGCSRILPLRNAGACCC
jgi:hypothetical protein